jgi:hypothetical protein
MWCEEYCCACSVDEETAYLVQEAYLCGQIDKETAERFFGGTIEQAMDPKNDK